MSTNVTEHEACAQICDRRVDGDRSREDAEAARCAHAIRARGQEASNAR